MRPGLMRPQPRVGLTSWDNKGVLSRKALRLKTCGTAQERPCTEVQGRARAVQLVTTTWRTTTGTGNENGNHNDGKVTMMTFGVHPDR